MIKFRIFGIEIKEMRLCEFFSDFRQARPLEKAGIRALLSNSKWISVRRRKAVLKNLEKFVAASFSLADTAGLRATTCQVSCAKPVCRWEFYFEFLETRIAQSEQRDIAKDF